MTEPIDGFTLILATIFGPLLVIGLLVAGYKTLTGRDQLMPPIFGLVQWGFGLSIGFFLITEAVKIGAYYHLGFVVLAPILAYIVYARIMNWYTLATLRDPELRDRISKCIDKCGLCLALPFSVFLYDPLFDNLIVRIFPDSPDFMQPRVMVPILLAVAYLAGITAMVIIIRKFKSDSAS